MSSLYKFLLVVFSLVFISACSDNSTDPVDDGDATETLNKQILIDFTDNTVIPTYGAMADNAVSFYNFCVILSEAKTNAAVLDAAESWKNTREHWEKSEAFLFGPANYNNLDPHLDTWPLDKNQLDQVLSREGAAEIDAAYVRDNFGSSLLGFHGVEYIIFRDGAPRSAADITPEEMAYLVAVAAVLRDDCITLEASWKGVAGISSEKQTYLEEAEIGISSVFGDELKKAGSAGSRYSSVTVAMNEVVQGCIDIADEVGNAKIAEPAQSGNVLDVESWYSWNSITDFKNNIRSIENVYLGGIDGSRGKGLTHFVQQKNSELDTEIKTAIAESLNKIELIGHPFRNNLGNSAGINAAVEACNRLMSALEEVQGLL